MFSSNGMIFPSSSVTLVSSNILQKSSWQTKATKRFDIFGCKIRKLKVGSVPAKGVRKDGVGVKTPSRLIFYKKIFSTCLNLVTPLQCCSDLQLLTHFLS